MINYNLSFLKELESEAIFVLREVAAQFERPMLLFSGGKDSTVIAHISKKAFWPAPIPYPFVHVDTGHNFPETIDFRDQVIKQLNAGLIIGSVQETIDTGRAVEEKGHYASRNIIQTVTLLDLISKHKFDACIGGARRDEEKARAKERFFSHRNEFGQWDPKNQRPELWNLFNGKKSPGEHFRAFPLSNWTEMDVWNYIVHEKIELPSIYFSHDRECIIRDGVVFAYSRYLTLKDGERPQNMRVRFRTVGDMTCTGGTLSEATTLEEVIHEIAIAKTTERGTRFDDKRSETAMEDRKKEGYF